MNQQLKKMSGTTNLASVKNASSTPSLTLADVSMKRMPSSSASSRPCSSVTARLSIQSDLLPIRILLTPSEACCSMFECQVWMSDEFWAWDFWEIERNTLRTVEGSLVRDVVYQKNTHCSTVICCSDCSKALLACSIPLIEGKWISRMLVRSEGGRKHYLKLDAIAVKFNRADLEVDTNRCDKGRSPCIVAETKEKAGLPDTWQ